MEFDVQVAHSVRDVGPQAWDRLAAGRPFASYRWYCFGEAVLRDDRPVYIILSRSGEPVARATFWVRHREPLPLSSLIVRRVLEAILRRWPLFWCQAPVVNAGGLILPDLPLREQALETIARVAEEQARENGASFVGCAYLDSSEAGDVGRKPGFAVATVADPGTLLDVAWPDFDTYVAHLTPKGQRQLQHNCARAAALGIEVRRETLPLASPERAIELVRAVERRHRSAPNPWVPEILDRACLVDSSWLVAEQQGQMAGCLLVLADGDNWLLSFIGLDYAFEYAYFALVYAGVRAAIEGGARALWGGSGSYETKRRLGFRLLDNNHAAFRGRGALLERIGRWTAT